MTSQEEQQQRRQPAEHDGQDRPGDGAGAVRYGDVFTVKGDLATAPVALQDAAMMQAAESAVLGEAPRGGAAAVMQSAARRNERLGVVPRDDEATDATAEGGVAVTEARVPGCRVITEFVADQPVGQYIAAEEEEEEDTTGGVTATAARQDGGVHGVLDGTKITIGEALEATVFSAGDQPVEASDAAAIAQAEGEADKTTLRQVLADATVRLGADKEVEREDAARVVGAEVRSDPDATARPAGVGASVAAAARLNRGRQ
ncbi:unnamed protein product [Miscanthus lutarioriparius]|uniref:SMP domain-containing protein n=1 Tax=Miscanthus lutarioriparius TaxID=422564 RepID=A0A811MXD3_9POAL|nr:unnamed protein product [Miscanthus lutarioriparius]